jgi:hypothetical protein
VIDCPREQDVLDAIAAGRWPGRADAELAAHVEGCCVCRDVALVAAVIGAEQESAWQHAQVPSSAHVWWRAQMRARREAARAAARPITVAQGIAGASAAGLAAAGIGYLSGTSLWTQWTTLLSNGRWTDGLPGATALGQGLRDTAASLTAAAASMPYVEFAVAAGLVLLLMPAALFFVFSEK